MNGNYEKMLSGEVYDAMDPELVEARLKTAVLCREYNLLSPADVAGKQAKLAEILGAVDETATVVQPFRCDYGRNIRVGANFFSNFNLTVLDEALVTVGDNCFIGPNVGLYTACHSTDPKERNTGAEWAKPINIGNNCWIGGNVVILPGVTVGDNCTIGAGSVVTKDIPSDSVAVGNPARVIRKIIED